MKTLVCCITLAAVNLFFAFQYFDYADCIGGRFGYLAALFVVPFIFGICIGALGVTIMCSGFRMKFYKKYWWILLLSAFFALLPSLYCVAWLFLVGDRGG